MEPMLSMIFLIPFDWAPRGYQFCRGQNLQVNLNQAVFSLVGFRYGGDGRSNFNLPDLQGRAPIGTGQLQNGSTSAPVYPLGQKGGELETTLTAAQLPQHTHNAAFTPTGSATASLPVSTTVPASAAQLTAGQTGYLTNATANNGPNNYLRGPYTTTTPTTTASLAGSVNFSTDFGGTVTVQPNVTPTTSFSNMPPYLAMHFVIAVAGIYPDRP